MWNEILELERKGGVICCGTKGDPTIEKMGLVKGHAYTIVLISLIILARRVLNPATNPKNPQPMGFPRVDR